MNRGRKMFNRSKNVVAVPNNQHNGNGNGRHVVAEALPPKPIGARTDPQAPIETRSGLSVFADISDLETLRQNLKARVASDKTGIILLGGLGGNVLEDVVGLDTARYGEVKILYADLDISSMLKAFRDSPELTEKLQKWMTLKSLSVLPLGGPDSGGKGAGATPSEGKEAAEHAESIEAIERWLKSVDIVLVVFAAGGGSGAGASEVVIKKAVELEKQVLVVAVMPDKKHKRRWRSATEVLRKTEKLAPTLVRQNQSMLAWLKSTMPAEKYDELGLKESWSEVNKHHILIALEMFLNLTVDTGDTQNIDVRNLEKATAKKTDSLDESRQLISSTCKLTKEEMKTPFKVKAETMVERLFDDPLGIAGVAEHIHSLLIQFNGKWATVQSDAILDGLEAKIMGQQKDGQDRADDKGEADREIMVFPGFRRELREGEDWSIHMLGVANNVTPGEEPNLISSPKSQAAHLANSPTDSLPAKPADMAGLYLRTVAPHSGSVASEVANHEVKVEAKSTYTAMVNGHVGGKPKTARVSEALAQKYAKAIREHVPEEVILALHEEIAQATVSEKPPEGIRFDSPKYLEAAKEDTKEKSQSSVLDSLRHVFKPAGLKAKPS